MIPGRRSPRSRGGANASLRGDAIAVAWLLLESTDVANEYQNTSEASRETLAARLLKTVPGRDTSVKWKAEYDSYIRRRTLSDKQGVNLRGVQQIEELSQMLREQEAATLVPPPTGMHSYDLGKHTSEQTTAETFDRLRSYVDKQLATIAP